MSKAVRKRTKKPGFAGNFTRDQMLRLSASIGLYKSQVLYFDEPIVWMCVQLLNRGSEFEGARPMDTIITGGL